MAELHSRYIINIARRVAMPMSQAVNIREVRFEHYAEMTLPESLADMDEAVAKLADVRQRFPEPEFKVDMTYWSISGTSVG